MVVPRPLRLVLAACAAWLLFYELRVLLAPDLEIRAAIVLALRARRRARRGRRRLPRARAVRGPERLAWALIGGGVLAWSLGEIYYTAVLWTTRDPPIPSLADAGYLLFPPLVAGRHARAAARPRPRRAAPAVGRRRDRRARRRRAERRDRLRDRARQRRGRAAGGRHRARLPAARPRAARAQRRRAGQHRLAARPHVDAARRRRVDLLARRLAVPRAHRPGRLRVGRLVRRRLVGRPDADRRRRVAAPAARASRAGRPTSACA